MLARAASRVPGALGSAPRRCVAATTGLADVLSFGLRGARGERSSGLTCSACSGCECAEGPAERLLRERRGRLELRLHLPQLRCTQRV